MRLGGGRNDYGGVRRIHSEDPGSIGHAKDGVPPHEQTAGGGERWAGEHSSTVPVNLNKMPAKFIEGVFT